MTPPVQCIACRHWQRHGGIVQARAWRCTALDRDAASPAMRALLLSIAADLARAGSCPMVAPFRTFPRAQPAAEQDGQKPWFWRGI